MLLFYPFMFISTVWHLVVNIQLTSENKTIYVCVGHLFYIAFDINSHNFDPLRLITAPWAPPQTVFMQGGRM